MNNGSEDDPLVEASPRKSYKLYRRRWYMLFVVVMFNFSNAMIWITFAPVANYSAPYFHETETNINWFSLVFFVAFVPCCGLAWWMIERCGFRVSVIVGTLLNALGAGIRVIGVYFCEKPANKFIVVLLGQTLSACTQPLVLSMPTKIAALWFGDHERTIANTIASISNPLGVLAANVVAVGLVTKPRDVELMLAVFGAPAVLAAILAIFGFNSSKPPTPPSASALRKPISFFVGIKEVLKNKQYLILVFASGSGIASFSFITTVIQQLICLRGYNDVVAGIAGAMIIVGGLVGSAISGFYIDKTRKYMPTSKLICCVMGLGSCAIIITSSLRGQTVLLILAFTLYGMCGLGGLPVFLELGVECTFPVDEATSSGIQWMIGQALGASMMIGGLASAPPLTTDEIKHSKCQVGTLSDSHPVNLTYPVLVIFSLCIIPSVIFIGCFDTPYKRLIAEREAASNDDDNLAGHRAEVVVRDAVSE